MLVFFGCLLASASYVSGLKDVAKLGSKHRLWYKDSPEIVYTIYKTPFGKACYLHDEIIVDCDEL